MKKWRMMSALALGLLAVPAVAMAQEQMAAEEVSIEQIQAGVEAASAEFVAALNGDNPTSSADYYTADAVLMPPGMPVVEGAAAVREFFESGMGGATLALEIWDVHAQGSDVALEVGGYEITGSDGSHLDHGKYMAIWSRTDDGWKMKYDIWNSSMAPPEMDHGAMHEEMHGDDEGHEMEAADVDDDGDAVDAMEEDDEM